MGGGGEFTGSVTVAGEVIEAIDAASAVETGPLRALVDVQFANIAAVSLGTFADESLSTSAKYYLTKNQTISTVEDLVNPIKAQKDP